MSTYTEFFLARNIDTMMYETLEISHPDLMVATYYFVINSRLPVIITLSGLPVEFSPVPAQALHEGVTTGLDFSLQVSINDVSRIFVKELQAIRNAEGTDVKPSAIYRVYSSLDLETPILGPFVLEIQDIAFNRSGVAFKCSPPSVNRTRTGVPYTISRFPTLRGLL